MGPPSIVPYLSYRDADAALRFLEDAFGFEVVVRWDDDQGAVQHAEVVWAGSTVMLGTGEHPAADVIDRSTGHGVYLVVDDVDDHYERSVASGAMVVFPPEDTAWGTRRYRVLDPEGYEWSFGSYRPGAVAGSDRGRVVV
jgi:uncharacterized glyoxalase superfamily protein PhnB